MPQRHRSCMSWMTSLKPRAKCARRDFVTRPNRKARAVSQAAEHLVICGMTIVLKSDEEEVRFEMRPMLSSDLLRRRRANL